MIETITLISEKTGCILNITRILLSNIDAYLTYTSYIIKSNALNNSIIYNN